MGIERELEVVVDVSKKIFYNILLGSNRNDITDYTQNSLFIASRSDSRRLLKVVDDVTERLSSRPQLPSMRNYERM